MGSILISEYRKEQQEAIERILLHISDLGLSFKIQYQNITSIVVSSEFDDDAIIDRVIGMFKKESGFTILADEPEFFVCTFGDDIATIVVSILNINRVITVNINL